MAVSSKKSRLTAVLNRFPSNLIAPKPLPGETILQCVVRNYPREWQNCLERREKDYALPASRRAVLIEGREG